MQWLTDNLNPQKIDARIIGILLYIIWSLSTTCNKVSEIKQNLYSSNKFVKNSEIRTIQGSNKAPNHQQQRIENHHTSLFLDKTNYFLIAKMKRLILSIILCEVHWKIYRLRKIFLSYICNSRNLVSITWNES